MPSCIDTVRDSQNPRNQRIEALLSTLNMNRGYWQWTWFLRYMKSLHLSALWLSSSSMLCFLDWKTHQQLSKTDGKNSVGTGGRHLLCIIIFYSCWKQQIHWCPSCTGQVQRAWPNCEYKEEQTLQFISEILGQCGICNGRYRHQCELSWGRLSLKNRPWQWGSPFSF